MQLIPYLHFDGQCREAFEFYRQALGGELRGATTYGESPMADQMPPEARDRVMHMHLEAAGATLMGADSPTPCDSIASQTCINVMVDDDAEAERIFAALADGGSVEAPMSETFWSHRFGMLTDRYGKPWMINHLREC